MLTPLTLQVYVQQGFDLIGQKLHFDAALSFDFFRFEKIKRGGLGGRPSKYFKTCRQLRP